MIKHSSGGAFVHLNTPRALPKASSFLWNKNMMIQMNCRGYASAQYMQPEPAKYARGPGMEAVSFMQPEHAYFSHHPGRFFYIKDEDSGEFFSLPYEPARIEQDSFEFCAGASEISWHIKHLSLELHLSLMLPAEDTLELWTLKVKNLDARQRKLSIYSYFPVGYMSWMNQSASYDPALNSIVCRSVTPYQKVEDYARTQHLKDLTFFMADRPAETWETRQQVFEGEGGLQSPTGLHREKLANGKALYETPAAIMQYRLDLASRHQEQIKCIFGPARDTQEIEVIKQRYLDRDTGFDDSAQEYHSYINQALPCIQVDTPHPALNRFVNHWLPRQVFYHGDVNRLSTDPQTRNYLQDAMGMVYVAPATAKQAFITTLRQQLSNGALPDGILLHPEAELKYINQVPHTDHNVWLPLCVQAYLDETDDYAFLDETLPFRDSNEQATVFEHINRAFNALLTARDERGLSFIAQGDWCDPMNMVGHKGRGVSSWLTLATAYAMKQWSEVCENAGHFSTAKTYLEQADKLNAAVNQHCWDGHWYSRGITDDNVAFGISEDKEGRIYLNPQSWALLSGAADSQQAMALQAEVDTQLDTPFGLMMLAPAYTGMREDVGRLTQKFPGTAENGSVYNHAAAFYSYAMFKRGHADAGLRVLTQMLPSDNPKDYLQRGQLPVFIPNYYRGAYFQHPEVAGRSSQLFNTGTVAWFYRCLIDGLLGLKGCRQGLRVEPCLPSDWPSFEASRKFRGAIFNLVVTRDTDCDRRVISVNGKCIEGSSICDIQPGETYQVNIRLPL